MNKKITIELPEATHLQAERRVQEKGLNSLSAYLVELIADDTEARRKRSEDLDAAIARGIADAEAGRLKPAEEVFARLEKKYRALSAKN